MKKTPVCLSLQPSERTKNKKKQKQEEKEDRAKSKSDGQEENKKIKNKMGVYMKNKTFPLITSVTSRLCSGIVVNIYLRIQSTLS